MLIRPFMTTRGSNSSCAAQQIAPNARVECEILSKCKLFRRKYQRSNSTSNGLRCRKRRSYAGDTFVEPTSGNTGIGLAPAAVVNGYKTTIVMSKKMSKEKTFVVEALGAKVIRTTEGAHDDPESDFQVTFRLAKELPNAHCNL